MNARRILAANVAGAAALTFTVSSLALLAAPAGRAAALSAGEAALVAVDTHDPIDAGGSQTLFTVKLPQGAACPGDTANANYLVNSYMVPESVSPEAVTYDGLGPTPNVYGDWATFRQALYKTTTEPFASVNTAPSDRGGEPGVIVNLPPMSFAVYRPGELPPGRYNVGIACTLFNKLTRYWNTRLVVSASTTDQPGGFTWRTADPAKPARRTASGPFALLAGVAVVGVAAFALTRRGLRHR